ncbi:M56 family metallopeptidase [Hyunsoonleella rubra]|uniref:M56 family metallopeptidase n=1 Tax=Hyunsoonleella rubra TaxID=1737062 RepID=A0ABW5TC45_9FLAO
MEFLLKSSAILAIFYLIYFIFLQRETFFEHNRWFLLSGILLSLIVPLITIPIYIEQAPLTFSNAELLYSDYTTFSSNADKPPTSFNFQDYILGIYFFGVAIFVSRLLFQLLSLIKISSGKIARKDPDVVIIETSKDITPFSFFKWIVYNPAQFDKQELQQILNHEKVHVKGLHSIDILLSQVYCTLFWFNPIAWLYSKSLKYNLEFIADERAMGLSDSIKDYQYALLKTITPEHNLSITNNFYNSSIKKRIIMLQKSKSKSVNLLKYLFILPALGWFLMSFNTEEVFISSQNNPDSVLDFHQNKEKSETLHVLDGMTDEQLQQLKEYLNNKEYLLKINLLERNHNGLITSIDLEIQSDFGNATFDTSSILPIKPIKIVLDKAHNVIEIGNPSSNEMKVVMGFPSPKEADVYKQSKRLKNIIPEEHLKNALIFLDNKEVSRDKISDLSSNDIERIEILEANNSIKKYGEKGENGAIEIETVKFTLAMHPGTGKSMMVADTKKGTTKFTGKANIKFSPDSLGLIVVDGNTSNKKELEKISPLRIESVNVLKNRYAKEKYGDTLRGDVLEVVTKTFAKNNEWKATQNRNRNIIHATKDTIYVHKKPDIIAEFLRDKNLNNTPLFIVDGKEVTKSDFALIDPLQVERMSIIKPGQPDLGEYGDKGKNGVVNITMRTENSKSPFVKVIGNPMFIVDGKNVTATEFHNIHPDNIGSLKIMRDKNSGSNKSIVKVVTK